MPLRTEQELAESAFHLALARRSSRELLLDHQYPAGTALRLTRSTPIRTMLPFSCRALAALLDGELESFWKSVDFAEMSPNSVVERFAFFIKRRVENGTLRLHFLPELLDFELASNELRYLPRHSLLQHVEPVGATPLTKDAGLAINPLVRISRFPCDAEAMFDALAGNPRQERKSRRESFLLLSVLRQPTPEIYQLEPKLGRRLWALQNVGTFNGSEAELRTLGGLRVIVRSH